MSVIVNSLHWMMSCMCVCVRAVSGAVSKQLVRIDSKYAALFNDATWKEYTGDRFDVSTRFGLYTLYSLLTTFYLLLPKYLIKMINELDENDNKYLMHFS